MACFTSWLYQQCVIQHSVRVYLYPHVTFLKWASMPGRNVNLGSGAYSCSAHTPLIRQQGKVAQHAQMNDCVVCCKVGHLQSRMSLEAVTSICWLFLNLCLSWLSCKHSVCYSVSYIQEKVVWCTCLALSCVFFFSHFIFHTALFCASDVIIQHLTAQLLSRWPLKKRVNLNSWLNHACFKRDVWRLSSHGDGFMQIT